MGWCRIHSLSCLLYVRIPASFLMTALGITLQPHSALSCPLNICCHFLYLYWFLSVEGDSSSASLGSAVILKYVRGVWIWGIWNFFKAKFCLLKPNTCILSGHLHIWRGAHILMLNVSHSTGQARLACALCVSTNLSGTCSPVLLSQLWIHGELAGEADHLLTGACGSI